MTMAGNWLPEKNRSFSVSRTDEDQDFSKIDKPRKAFGIINMQVSCSRSSFARHFAVFRNVVPISWILIAVLRLHGGKVIPLVNSWLIPVDESMA
jgi:hypothetical protein